MAVRLLAATIFRTTVGTYAYTRDRPVGPVTIHATHDKAHILNGYFRYTADGALISETRSVGIRIYKGSGTGAAPVRWVR